MHLARTNSDFLEQARRKKRSFSQSKGSATLRKRSRDSPDLGNSDNFVPENTLVLPNPHFHHEGYSVDRHTNIQRPFTLPPGGSAQSISLPQPSKSIDSELLGAAHILCEVSRDSER